MAPIPLIQYLPLVRPQASFRYLHRLSNGNVMCILDLEDSVQDIFDMHETMTLKQQALDGLRLISSYCTWNTRKNLYVRINGASTIFYRDDIDAVLCAVKNGMPITGIFLPKVEDYSALQSLYDFFLANGITMEIVPMIETRVGLMQLPSILRKDVNARLIKRVHYGHFDFCLDCEIWPFPQPNHLEFWNIVESILNVLSEFNVGYVHTPFPDMYNAELFWGTMNHLQRKSGGLEVWGSTLNTELSLSRRLCEVELHIISAKNSLDEKIAAANRIVEMFASNIANKRSFGLINGQFVPPHQYLAAKQFLKSHLS